MTFNPQIKHVQNISFHFYIVGDSIGAVRCHNKPSHKMYGGLFIEYLKTKCGIILGTLTFSFPNMLSEPCRTQLRERRKTVCLIYMAYKYQKDNTWAFGITLA